MTGIEGFLDRVEGTPMVHHQEDNTPVLCDSCASAVHPNRRLTAWWTTRDPVGRGAGFTFYRAMCMDCTPPARIWRDQGFSPVGWLEIVVEATLSVEKELVDCELYAASTPSEGGEWTPVEAHRALFGMDGAAARQMTMEATDGPYDVIDAMVFAGIDPREYVQPEGIVREASGEEAAENLHKLASEWTRKADPDRMQKIWERLG